MATELIAIGTSAADSGDIVVAAGTPVTIGLKDASGPDLAIGCQVEVYLKDDAGQYFQVGSLRSEIQSRSIVLVGPGTYRASRVAGSASCGVFSA